MTSSRWPQIHASLTEDPADVMAWQDLEDEVSDLVHRYLPGLDHDVSQDVVERVCFQVIADLGEGLDPRTFQGVVYGHVLAAGRSMLSRDGAGPGRSDAPTDGPDVAGLLRDDPGELVVAMLAQCLGSLPERDRRAVELRYFQQASLADIAADLGVTEAEARPVVFSGLARLRTCMGARRAWSHARSDADDT